MHKISEIKLVIPYYHAHRDTVKVRAKQFTKRLAKEGIAIKQYKENYANDTITVLFQSPQDKMAYLLKYKTDDLYRNTGHIAYRPHTISGKNPRGHRR